MKMYELITGDIEAVNVEALGSLKYNVVLDDPGHVSEAIIGLELVDSLHNISLFRVDYQRHPTYRIEKHEGIYANQYYYYSGRKDLLKIIKQFHYGLYATVEKEYTRILNFLESDKTVLRRPIKID